MTTCLACAHPVLEDYYNPGPQPLAAFALPGTNQDAYSAPRYPMRFKRCVKCGHIFNTEFDVSRIPYNEDSNLMYNSGHTWADHIDRLAGALASSLLDGETVIDIGAGDGDLLCRTRELTVATKPNILYIAFEPGREADTCIAKGLHTYRSYFVPQRDMERFQPATLICRHVLEHMTDPRKFVGEIAAASRTWTSKPRFLAEVPCIDKAVKQGRVSDYLYEHVSNFTRESLQALFETTGWFTKAVETRYNDEVLLHHGQVDLLSFSESVSSPDVAGVQAQLQAFSNHITACWGGTGKSSSFLNAYDLGHLIVVDSDERKVGKYVPGTGQLIQSPKVLNEPVCEIDTIIITTRWRAHDIYHEIKCNHPQITGIYIVDGNTVRLYTEADYEQETQ